MKNPGFTLIEVIVYIGLFSMLMSGALITVFTMLSSIQENRNEITLYREAQFINNKLSWALTGASDVSFESSSMLEIERKDLESDSPLKFSIADGQFFLQRGTNPVVLLTRKDFYVSNIEITMRNFPNLNSTELIIKYSLNGVPFKIRTFI